MKNEGNGGGQQQQQQQTNPGPHKQERPPNDNKKNGKLKSFVIPFLSGGIAGITAKTSIAPLERVKIMFQVRITQYEEVNRGVFHVLSAVSKREGLKGLFKGNGATILRVFPYAAIQFTTFEQARKVLKLPPRGTHKQASIVDTTKYLLAGSAAGAVSSFCTYPLDVIRARLAIENFQSPSKGVPPKAGSVYISAIRRYSKKDGWRGYYRGMGPTILGILPYAGINYSAFETLKSLIPASHMNEKGELPVHIKLVCGGLAGAIGQTVAYPLDVVRRRMQTAGYAEGLPPVNLNDGTFKAMENIIKTEGVRALFKGISINYYKVVPTVSISFTAYEYFTGVFTALWNKLDIR
eukprot:TRINITY_DN92_c0_g5_i1.p1 TRINITY_DN92_c0_g5~~TRINITY_DN92_c0_g5_i1.p1  ORF type:complete len:351 (-),score=59.58 TRINITY_DN92_c0_g5_i1:1038-2090(-)